LATENEVEDVADVDKTYIGGGPLGGAAQQVRGEKMIDSCMIFLNIDIYLNLPLPIHTHTHTHTHTLAAATSSGSNAFRIGASTATTGPRPSADGGERGQLGASSAPLGVIILAVCARRLGKGREELALIDASLFFFLRVRE
jgi:hypothetical protein